MSASYLEYITYDNEQHKITLGTNQQPEKQPCVTTVAAEDPLVTALYVALCNDLPENLPNGMDRDKFIHAVLFRRDRSSEDSSKEITELTQAGEDLYEDAKAYLRKSQISREQLSNTDLQYILHSAEIQHSIDRAMKLMTTFSQTEQPPTVEVLANDSPVQSEAFTPSSRIIRTEEIGSGVTRVIGNYGRDNSAPSRHGHADEPAAGRG